MGFRCLFLLRNRGRGGRKIRLTIDLLRIKTRGKLSHRWATIDQSTRSKARKRPTTREEEDDGKSQPRDQGSKTFSIIFVTHRSDERRREGKAIKIEKEYEARD